MGDYVARLPKELRGELVQVLRGRELVEYCKRYECKIDWRRRLFRDYGVKDKVVTSMGAYTAFVVGEELGLPAEPDLIYMSEELEAAARKANPKAVEYFLFEAETWLATRIFTNQTQRLYNYMWDTYPTLRQYLVLNSLAFDESLLHPPRIMEVPIEILIEWMPFLRRAYDHQEEYLRKMEDVIGVFRG